MIHDATTGNNYSYDAENRITGAAGYTYIYDADGNRVEKSNGSTGTIYWPMSPGIVAESDLQGNIKSEYVFFGKKRVARRDFPSGTVSYYFSDSLGTANVITDSAGNIKEDEDFNPWGGELPFINNDPNHYKHNGNERDTETGLDYRVNRYSSNQLGRFLSPDWAGKPTTVPYADFGNPQSLNLYSYGKNNPMTFADPDGHCDWCQKLKNAFKGNGWRTDQQVKDDAQAFRNSVGKDQQVGTYNRDTGEVKTYNRDQLNKMSDSQVVQLKDQLDNSQPANQEDLQNIAKVIGAAVPAVIKPPASPTQSPGPDWQWRGKGAPGTSEGAWYNPKTGESLHPDLSHPDPIGPHWDYRDASGKFWRIFADGTMQPK